MSCPSVELPSKKVTVIKNALTQKIVEFCGKDARPMEIVAGSGFQSLAQFLVRIGSEHGNIDVCRILPHPTTVSRHIPDVKKAVSEKIFPVIRKAMINYECSATTDIWTDDFKKNSFMAMTVHFFDENFFLKKHVLFTSIFGDSNETKKIIKKSGQNIEREMINSFESLGYERELLKKVKFVTDLGSNVVLALKGYHRNDCKLHRLNTILQNTFDSDDVPLIITKTLKICKRIVSHLKQSGKMNKLPKAVVQECDTRWNTNLGMLQSIITQYEQIMELLTVEQRSKWYLDVDLAKEIASFLTPFKEATLSLEGDTYVTSSKILLWWENLSMHLKEENFISSPVKRLVTIAKTFFTQKYEINMENKIACFLDPRYRFLKMLPEDERIDVFNEIKRQLRESCGTTDDEPPTKKSRFAIYEECSGDRKSIDEFEIYMQNADFADYLNTTENKKHLVELFWRNNKEKFPKLYLLAKRSLHVPASSSSSESVFSCSGDTYGKKRTNLKPKNLDDLVFLKKNLEI